MKKLKSRFWYTKNQRNGILLLLGIIIILQFLYHNINFRDTGLVSFNQAEISVFQHQIDSLKLASIEDRKFKIYPFNPNFISDYKGYQLGMKTKEIDRLLAYRKKRLFVNSAKEFQTITKVSDSLLQKISPYFKFPEWVQKKNKEKKERLTLQLSDTPLEQICVRLKKTCKLVVLKLPLNYDLNTLFKPINATIYKYKIKKMYIIVIEY